MQRCRISNGTITEQFLIGLSSNLAWLLLRLQAITLPFLNLLRWNFFWWIFFTWRGSNFLKISIFWGPFKSIFELTVNLGLVLTKLDTELGLAQPQLVNCYHSNGQLGNESLFRLIIFSRGSDTEIRVVKYQRWKIPSTMLVPPNENCQAQAKLYPSEVC